MSPGDCWNISNGSVASLRTGTRRSVVSAAYLSGFPLPDAFFAAAGVVGVSSGL